MAKYEFFYSSRDAVNSKKAVAIMTQFNMNHLFTPISIEKDRSGKRPTIVQQLGVKMIPAIYANGRLYQGEDCFKLLQQLSQNPQECTTVRNEPMPSKTPGFVLARKPILPANFNPSQAVDQPVKTTTTPDGGDYQAILSQFGGAPKRSETDVFGMPAPPPEKESASSNRLTSVWGK